MFTGAGGTADAVNMHLRIPGQLEIHHQRQGFDVQTAGSDVGRHQNPDAAVSEAHQRLIPIALLKVTMQRQGALPGGVERIADRLAIAFGIAEHHAGCGLMLAEQALQQGNLTVAGNFKELLLNRRERIDSVDLNCLRIALHPAADRRDCRRPGSREQQRLPVSRCEADHLINGIAKAHIEHAVRFVHHQGLQRVKGDRSLLQMIEQTARGGDDNMRGMLQGISLGAKGLPAAEHQNLDVRQAARQAAQLAGDLIGQLAGRAQHQRLGLEARRIDMLQQTQPKCGRFSAAGFCLHAHIFPREDRRQGGGLNRGHRQMTQLVKVG